MNNTFSFKRIGLILRADWIEHKRIWMLKMGLMLLTYTLLFWDHKPMQDNLIGWTFFIFTILFFNYMGKKIHGQKGLFLTLPASNPEKFVALWLVALFFFVSCFLIFGVINVVNNLFYGLPPLDFVHNISHIGIVSFAAFFICWQFASYMTFRKSAFLIGIALNTALSVVVMNILIAFGVFGSDIEKGLMKLAEKLTEYNDAYYYVIIYILCAALLSYSYWRLTKKRIR